MRHRKSRYKLGRNSSQRKSLLRNLAADIIEKSRIKTTLTKAKAVRPFVEKMITLGKSGTLADKRRVLSHLYNRKTVHLLFNEVAIRFMDRNGGYTRIIKDGYRDGDSAEMAYIEFVDFTFKPKKKSKDKLKDKVKKK